MMKEKKRTRTISVLDPRYPMVAIFKEPAGWYISVVRPNDRHSTQNGVTIEQIAHKLQSLELPALVDVWIRPDRSPLDGWPGVRLNGKPLEKAEHLGLMPLDAIAAHLYMLGAP